MLRLSHKFLIFFSAALVFISLGYIYFRKIDLNNVPVEWRLSQKFVMNDCNIISTELSDETSVEKMSVVKNEINNYSKKLAQRSKSQISSYFIYVDSNIASGRGCWISWVGDINVGSATVFYMNKKMKVVSLDTVGPLKIEN